MDKLKHFLKSIPLNERESFAARCGTTWPFLRNVMYGQRMPGEKLCVAIERETNGAVTRKDLRPDDWQEIWPELAQQSSPDTGPVRAKRSGKPKAAALPESHAS